MRLTLGCWNCEPARQQDNNEHYSTLHSTNNDVHKMISMPKLRRNVVIHEPRNPKSNVTCTDVSPRSLCHVYNPQLRVGTFQATCTNPQT